jgi:HlyD family secretion protein
MNHSTTLRYLLALAITVCVGDFKAAKAEPKVITAGGRVEPTEVVEISSRVAGSIARLSADHGDKVAQGQVLAQLDDAVYRVEVDRAQAGVRKAQARLELAKAKMSLAKRQLERLAKLRDTGAAEQSGFETAKAEVEVAEAGMRLEEAGILESEAALTRAKLDLDACTIRAPIDGIVLERRCTVGQAVAGGAGPGLFRIASNLKTVHVVASVPEADIARVAAGQAAEITVEALPGQKFEGKVKQVRLGAAGRRGSGVYAVVIVVDNPGERLLPYLTAKVSIAVGDR